MSYVKLRDMEAEYPQPDTFGWRFKKALIDNGAPVTQQGAKAWLEKRGRDLEIGIEISTTMIFNYYREELPRVDQCRKYALALGKCVEWLYTGEGPEAPLNKDEKRLVGSFKRIRSELGRARALSLVEGMATAEELAMPASDQPGDNMPKKQSSSRASTIASKVLAGTKKPTRQEVKTLAASVLGQDEKKGQRKR